MSDAPTELAPVVFDRRMRFYRMQAPEVEYSIVSNLVELLFRAKMHTHETVRDFLRNMFAQKVPREIGRYFVL